MPRLPGPRRAPRRLTSPLLVVLIVASIAGLAAAYAMKAQCLNRDWDGVQFRRLCYNDAQPLYVGRALNEGRFPYLHSTTATRDAQQDLEYPVGTGLYLGTIASITSTPTGFFNVNAAGLAAVALIAGAVLLALAREPARVLLYALGPAMVLYAFHNWDLLAVGLATLAMYAYTRRANGWTGLLLGLGAATKLYPLFLLPAMALGAWKRGGGPPWRLFAAFVGAFAALNIPFMIANFDGWQYAWNFQASRPANYETSWYMVYRHVGGSWFRASGVVNTLSFAIFGALSVALIVLEARRERPRPFALAFGILAAFLLTAKVYSPQYALWLLPFFVVLGLPWWSYAAWVVTDLAGWIATSAFFLAVQFHDLTREPAWGVIADERLNVLEAAVWARYAVLVMLVILSVGTRELVVDPE